MNWSKFKNEIETAPAEMRYGGKTNQQIANLLNAPNRTKKPNTFGSLL